MQKEVNDRLTMMDSTIRTVHEGQTLNDKNIQLLMKKMDIFGEQMKLLHQSKKETPSKAIAAPENVEVKESESPQGRRKQTNIIPYTAPQEAEEDAWDENFAAPTEDFDTIMTDAE
jgi:hypothetical protein